MWKRLGQAALPLTMATGVSLVGYLLVHTRFEEMTDSTLAWTVTLAGATVGTLLGVGTIAYAVARRRKSDRSPLGSVVVLLLAGVAAIIARASDPAYLFMVSLIFTWLFVMLAAAAVFVLRGVISPSHPDDPRPTP